MEPVLWQNMSYFVFHISRRFVTDLSALFTHQCRFSPPLDSNKHGQKTGERTEGLLTGRVVHLFDENTISKTTYSAQTDKVAHEE